MVLHRVSLFGLWVLFSVTGCGTDRGAVRQESKESSERTIIRGSPDDPDLAGVLGREIAQRAWDSLLSRVVHFGKLERFLAGKLVPAQPPEECHLEMLVLLAQGRPVYKGFACVGKCEKRRVCTQIRTTNSETGLSFIWCACSGDLLKPVPPPAECHGLGSELPNDRLDLFCVGTCPKGKDCVRGWKVDKSAGITITRVFCACKKP